MTNINDNFTLKENVHGIHIYENITGNYICTTKTHDTAMEIVEALEKQIAKTLAKDSIEDEIFISGTVFERKIKACPICKNIYIREKQAYCDDCGQKLD